MPSSEQRAQGVNSPHAESNPCKMNLQIKLIPLAGLLLASASWGDFSDPLRLDTTLALRPISLSGSQAPAPCSQAQESATFSLAEAVDVALCNNPQTREVWANARYQAALVGVAQSAYLPGLDAKLTRAHKDSSSSSAYRQDTGTLTLSWLIYDFGGRSASLESARQLFEAAAASQDDKIQSVFLGTLQAYYQVQANAAALEAAKVSEQAAEQNYLAAEARYRAGMVTPADKLQAQTAWSQAKLQTLQASSNWQTARGLLATTLGRDAHQAPSLSTPLALSIPEDFERDIAQIITMARERRADLRAAEAQVNAARANIDIARAAGRPSFSLAAVGGRERIDSNPLSNTTSLGVTLALPVFSGFSTTYKVKAAETQAEVKAAQRDRIRLQVAQDVWNAYQNLQTAIQSLRTSRDLLSSAEAAARMAKGRYQAGVGSLLDMLSAQTALASARQQQIQAAYNWNLYRATLAQSMGALDADFLRDIQLGESTPPITTGKSRP